MAEIIEKDEPSSGIQSFGESNDWKSIERTYNSTIHKVIDIVKVRYCNEKTSFEEKKDINILLYVNEFMKFLDKKKLEKIFNLSFTDNELSNFYPSKNTNKNKNKKNENNIVNDIVLSTNIRKINEEFEYMNIDEYTCIPIDNNNYFYTISKYFYIIFWSSCLYKNIEKLSNEVILNCIISLSRSIEEYSMYLDSRIKQQSNELLKHIKEMFCIKMSSEEKIYEYLFKNPKYIVESYWDISKPKSVSLYREQQKIIDDSLYALNNDKPMVRFYKVPPGSGKTFIAAPLAVALDSINTRIEKKKYLLYICYNSIVRNDVASMCNSINVDIPFWTATSMNFGINIETLLRPYKNCFQDFKKSRKDRENKERFGSLEVQWSYFMRTTEYKPKIIISDLVSAYNLMNTYPDRFIPYFDEAFAGADQEITIKILKILPKISILVSATLPELNEVPSFVNHFNKRFDDSDENTFKIIDSNSQHISCTFIDPEGYIYLPHYTVELEGLNDYIQIIINDPIKIRAYSPDIVYNMVKGRGFEKLLPEHLRFNNKFNDYGKIRHDNLRFYALEILSYIAETKNSELFEILKENRIKKFNNIEQHKMLTANAPNYKDGMTLHVSSQNNFNNYSHSLLSPLFLGNTSININKIIDSYEEMFVSKEKKIESLKKGITKENKDRVEYQIEELTNQPVRVRWPQKFIPNTYEHSEIHKYEYDNNPAIGSKVNITKFRNATELFSMAFLSGIGIYNPEEMNIDEKSIFMEYKDNLNFILSTPSIIYGTNMNISIVDIGEEYSQMATRNSLFQLVGRAGRKGKKTYSAMVIFRTWEMLNKIMAPTFDNVEARLIEVDFKKIYGKSV
jgi:hypothetical protein